MTGIRGWFAGVAGHSPDLWRGTHGSLHLTLTKKIYASFGVVLVLLFGVAGAAYWAFATMADSTHQIAKVAGVKAEDANTVGGLAAYIHESQTRFVLTRNARYADHPGDVQQFQDLATTARELERLVGGFTLDRDVPATGA